MRAFNTEWSTLTRGLVASGSDDKSINVWKISLDGSKTSRNIKLAPYCQLLGHRSNVRALNWSDEHSAILISGSWDSTIRIWDVDRAVCLQVVCDHVADVYSITSHYKRPFTFVSCSRDTTVRVWELGGLCAKMRAIAIWQGSLDELTLAGRQSVSQSDGAVKGQGEDASKTESESERSISVAQSSSSSTSLSRYSNTEIENFLENSPIALLSLSSVIQGKGSTQLSRMLESVTQKWVELEGNLGARPSSSGRSLIESKLRHLYPCFYTPVSIPLFLYPCFYTLVSIPLFLYPCFYPLVSIPLFLSPVSIPLFLYPC